MQSTEQGNTLLDWYIDEVTEKMSTEEQVIFLRELCHTLANMAAFNAENANLSLGDLDG